MIPTPPLPRARVDERITRPRSRSLLVGAFAVVGATTLVLGACAGAGRSAHPTASTTSRTVRRVTSAGGVVSSAPPGAVVPPTGAASTVAAGHVAESAVLPDRTLTVGDAHEEPGTRGGALVISVTASITNTSAVPITSESAAFRLIGPEGDVFAAEPAASSSLDGAVAAHATKTGTASFEVPAAAASRLQLLYRPDGASAPATIGLGLG